MLYQPDTCAYCKSDTWCERRKNGKPQCRACKIVAFFNHYLYPPLGIRLMRWQENFLRKLYGTVDPATGNRLYNTGYRSVAKKNGKTELCGGLPIYHLLADGEEYPAVYSAASAAKQARGIYRAAAKLVRKNPDLLQKLKLLPATDKIIRRDGAGFYEVLSAEGGINDGIEPSCAILDELHRWSTKQAETSYDVITKGTLTRAEPMIVEITTAGDEYESPLWFNEHQDAQRFMAGESPRDGFYAEIDCADVKRIQADPEYWQSREARVAANPAHEDRGGILKDKRIVEEMQKAIAQPSKYYSYLRYHLNVPIAGGTDPVIDMPVWRECIGPEDVSQWPAYDAEYLALHKWNLRNRPCYPGIDIAWTTDFTALVLPFPPEGDDDHWYLLPFLWIPEDRVAVLERDTRQPLKDWIRRGFLMATARRDEVPEAVKQKLLWASTLFDVREIGYDPWNCRDLGLQLEREGFTPVEVRQGPPTLSAPTKKLLDVISKRKLIHGNHPVLSWQASCLSLEVSNDNCKPAKPKRDTSAKRIDAISAAVTGMNRALLAIAPDNPYADASKIFV